MSNQEIVEVEFEEREAIHEDSIPEAEEHMESQNIEVDDSVEQNLDDKIKEKIETVGYAYVYDGEILDEKKLTFNSKIYCIFNQRTGLPFIYDGMVVRFGGIIEATAALNVLKIYTSNNDLRILDYSELKGKSLL